MQDQPLISVITVTYNAGKVVGKTLESLNQQSFRDFEHIVIDGNSSDNTLEVVREHDLPQGVLISEPDNGLYDAMNKGLRLAKGKYIIFLNAGDAFHSSKTLEQYSREALKDKDIIYGETVITGIDGKMISPRHLSAPEVLTKNSFADGMLICHQAFMVRKDLAPFYDLSYRFSADYDWCIKCITKSSPEKCSYLNEVTVDYLSDGLTDKNKLKSLKERFRIMASHYGMAPTFFRHLKFIVRALRRGKI